MSDAGRVSREVAQRLAEAQFERYEERRQQLEASEPTSDFDRLVEDAKRLERPEEESEA